MKFIEIKPPVSTKVYLINVEAIETVIAVEGKGRTTIKFKAGETLTFNIEYADLKKMIENS